MKKYLKTVLLFLAILLISCNSNEASNLSLASLFQDHMVAQQNTLITVWGWANPNSSVKLATSWGEKGSVESDSTGAWQLKIATPKADNIAHKMTITSGGEEIKIEDILLGEVWLASGQSNMEMPLKGFGGNSPKDKVEGAEKAIQAADYPGLRMFTVGRNIAFEPQEKVEGSWVVCSPETAPSFSAVAYFFGEKLHQELGIPVGLIHSSWTGSPAESWVNQDFLEKIEGKDMYRNEFSEIASRIELSNDPDTPFNQWMKGRMKKEWSSLFSSDQLSFVNKENNAFIRSNFDDNTWEESSLEVLGNRFKNNTGIAWARQSFEWNQDNADDLVISLGETGDLFVIFINDELIVRKESWGKSKSKYEIPNNLIKKGSNTISMRFYDVGQKGFLKGNEPIGLYDKNKRVVDLKTNWKTKITAARVGSYFFELKEEIEKTIYPSDQRMPYNSHASTSLYNGMISPLLPYTLKGFIWYQGESNRSRAEQYKTLFPALIDCWREQWGDENLPFYYVQIAPVGDNGMDSNSPKKPTGPEIREAQMVTLSKANVGMAVTTDVGDSKFIHAPKKKPIGERLALWALAKNYGYDGLVHCGPIYKSVQFEKGKALISFDHTGSGLYCPDKKIRDFEIAGKNGTFHIANARILGDRILVWSKKVSAPKYVRFGWKNYIKTNLYNKEGLPASSFRTYKK